MTSNKPTISDISFNPERPGKRDLYVDGVFYLSVPVELLEDLYVGAPFGEEEEAALLLAAKLIPAKEKAYQYLAYGDLSRKKLYEKLTRFGIESEVADAACDKMEEQGFINDERLAENLAQRYASSKKWGPRRISQELYQKGIPSTLAKEVVDTLETDFKESVEYHLSTKYRGRDFSDRAETQKVIQGLMR